MRTYSVLKKYAVFTLVLGLFSLLLVLVVKSRISDNSVSPETERVYKVPQRRGIDLDPQGAKVKVTDVSASQHEAQKVLPPPEKYPNLEKMVRLKEIEALFEKQAGRVIRNPVKILEMIKLEKEMVKLHQEIKPLDRANEGRLLKIKTANLVLPHLTNDNRLPVSVGEEMVEVLVEGGDLDGAATIYMATQHAMGNGDEFFMAEHWTDGGAYKQAGTDPCCPEETTPVHLEDRDIPEPPHFKQATPLGAKNVERNGWEGLSSKQQEQAKTLFDEYGTEEGLRRFREMDPDAARRFERERRGAPSRDAQRGDGYSDEQPPDDAP